MFQHVLVVGSTGSGKTYTVSRIISKAMERDNEIRSVIVFDWHGEYAGLLDLYEYISPWSLPVNIIGSDIYETVDLISDVLELTHPQSFMVEKILSREKISDINELYRILESIEDIASWMRESRLSLLRKLSPIVRDAYIDLFKGDRDNYVNLARRSINVINISEIKDPLIRRIYVAFHLKKLFSLALERRLRGRLLIVIEEAHNLLNRDRPIGLIGRMIAEVRKFGIGLVIVTQSPSTIVEDVMVNTNTKIIHSLKSSYDIDLINRTLYLTEEFRQIIPYLDVGEAIICSRTYKKPLLVRIK